MSEILPIKLLTEEEASIFGALNVSLGKLAQLGLPVAPGIVVSPPNLKLKTVLEHFEFKSKEVFEQSLTLVKKEINTIEIPPALLKEVGKHKKFLVNGKILKSVKELWLLLLDEWIEEVRAKLWKEGFYKGVTENLEPKAVIFIKKIEGMGGAYFDNFGDDTVISIQEGKLHPNDLKKLDELVKEANKKLFIPHQYEWIMDGGVKLVGIKPYTPANVILTISRPNEVKDIYSSNPLDHQNDKKISSAVKVFLDLSTGLVVEKDVDGIYIASEKIFDLNKPLDSFEDLVFRLVESAATFPNNPVLFKLADQQAVTSGYKSEGMGKVRGTQRLLHQKSLLEPMLEAADFIRHKRNITNVHLVIPFVRTVHEFLQIKRELAVKKLMRKNSLQIWMEIAIPENIINLEDYVVSGLDGMVLNLDELISHLNGFDHTLEELMVYKNEANGLLKFLEDGLKLLHKSKIPFIVTGTLSLYPQVLEFLVEKGVEGIVVERYEASSIKDLLHQAEKRLIVRRSV